MTTKVIIPTLVLILLGVYLFFNNKISQNLTRENPNPKPSLITQATTECNGNPTPSQTEGPYYKTGSPKSNNIANGIVGQLLFIEGIVYDKECKPIPNAWLDFWQADANGVYDNTGYTLRGHQFTDANGRFHLTTIIPKAYESRPPHIHVKIGKTSNSPILTSQLYFPDQEQNQTDSIFNNTLVMVVYKGQDGQMGEFNFVLPE